MSNLDNVYGVSNSCPAPMNDGRGVNTNFKPRNEYFNDLVKELKVSNDVELKKKLRPANFENVVTEFRCNQDPDGEVVVSQNIGSLLSNNGGSSWRDNFRDLKN